MTHKNLTIAALAILINLGACAVEDESVNLGSDDYQALRNNGLRNNGLRNNGLAADGLLANTLVFSKLPQSSQSYNGLSVSNDQSWGTWLNANADHDNLMSYVVRCALPANASASHIDSANVTRSWSGETGLAPNWLDGGMTLQEQRLVSSCVISLVNGAEQQVTISQRGAAYSVTLEEIQQYSIGEGAFFGNLFSSTRPLFACSFSADFVAPDNGRVCTMTDVNGDSVCDPVEALGTCADICDTDIRYVDGVSYTTFSNCEGSDGVVYPEVTTTYLHANTYN